MNGRSSPEPATPGSYGELPKGYRLPEAARVGQVRLQVADLERSLEFYRQILGFHVLQRENGRASLGAGDNGQVLVELLERKGARRAGRGLLGLFHFAILLPDRAALGRFVRHLAETGTRAGAGDHLVSEAFYLTDPDGLGIEVYADRPQSTWQRIGREIMMTTDPVDVDSIVGAAGETRWTGMPEGTVIGHVHLHVGNLDEAKAFYSEALGFDRTTWSYPGALFMSAGGYHHHLATNTWAGATARPPAEEDARLIDWSLELPTSDDVMAAVGSVGSAGYSVQATGADTLIEDPWGTRVRLCAIMAGSLVS